MKRAGIKFLKTFWAFRENAAKISLARISHTISRQVGQDVATDALSDTPKTLSVDKARAFESEDGVTDCPTCPREREKCGLTGVRTIHLKFRAFA